MALSNLVEMPGWLDADEARALCARADILVLPSYAEGMAMAVIEGLAHGLAVVTTRVGAHEEAISDGETGIFVPVGDKDALAAALAKLVVRSRNPQPSLGPRPHPLSQPFQHEGLYAIAGETLRSCLRATSNKGWRTMTISTFPPDSNPSVDALCIPGFR